MDAYIISLDPDHYAAAAAVLAPFELTLHHEPAVRGAALAASELSTVVTRDARAQLGQHIRKSRLPSLGAVGCYLSHVNLWRRAAAASAPIIVFEDDVAVAATTATAGTLETLISTATRVEPEWDILLFDWFVRHVERAVTPTAAPPLSHLAPGNGFYLTTAYAITPRGAARLLNGALPMHVQVDQYMGAAARLGDITTLLATPRIFHQHRQWASTIQPSRAAFLKDVFLNDDRILVAVGSLAIGICIGVWIRRRRVVM